MFSGETDTEKYYALIESAVLYVGRQLKKSEYETDSRVPFYVASVANLVYSRAVSMRYKLSQTYAGSVTQVPSETNVIVCGMAEKLCEGYRSLCSDILKDDTFWFVLSGDDVEN